MRSIWNLFAGASRAEKGLAVRVRIGDSGRKTGDDSALESLIGELTDAADTRTEGDKIKVDRSAAGCVLTFMTRDVDTFIVQARKAVAESPLNSAVSVWIEDWAHDLSMWREVRFSSNSGD